MYLLKFFFFLDLPYKVLHLLLNISLGINCAINEYNLEIENFQIEDFSKANERMAKILNHSVNGSYGGDSDDSGHILKDDNIRRNCGHEIFFFFWVETRLF